MTTIPLAPKNGGGQCLGLQALQRADIIVTTASSVVSWGIRAAESVESDTISYVSHAMIYAGHGRVIEAIGGGVGEHDLEKDLQPPVLSLVSGHLCSPQAHHTRCGFP